MTISPKQRELLRSLRRGQRAAALHQLDAARVDLSRLENELTKLTSQIEECAASRQARTSGAPAGLLASAALAQGVRQAKKRELGHRQQALEEKLAQACNRMERARDRVASSQRSLRALADRE